MSYALERKVITNHLQANSFYGITPFAIDGDTDEITAGGGFMTILSGQGNTASVGSPGANRHEYTGVLSITILAAGGGGTGSAVTLADAVIDGLTGLRLDEDGGTPDVSSTMVIDFTARGLAPHIASSRPEAPFQRVVVNAPFVRIERK